MLSADPVLGSEVSSVVDLQHYIASPLVGDAVIVDGNTADDSAVVSMAESVGNNTVYLYVDSVQQSVAGYSLANTSTDDPEVDGDGDLDDSQVGLPLPANSSPDLKVYFTDLPDAETATPGSTLDYTVVVENVGSADVIGGTVELNLPAYLSTPSLVAATPSVGATTNLTATADLAVTQLLDTIDVPIGATVTYELLVTLSADLTDYPSPNAMSSLLVTASLPEGEVDENPDDNTVADHNLVQLQTSAGEGVFENSGQVLGDQDSRNAVIGDVDGDGDLDAIVSSDGPGGSEVWLNDGTGVLIDSGQVVGTRPAVIQALGDVDGDGDLDLLLPNPYTPVVSCLYLNDGAGNFSSAERGLTSAYYGVGAFVDVNSDGALDAILNSRVFLNDGAGWFTLSSTLAGSPTAYGDIDGDGDIDVLSANSMQLNEGNGTFAAAVTISTSANTSVLFDVDGDGDLDAMFAHATGLSVWINDGGGGFTDAGQLLGTGRSNHLAVGDIDGDGDLDVLASNAEYQDDGLVGIWLNDGDGNFSASNQVIETRGVVSTTLADLDGDGDLDAILVNVDGPNQVWMNPAGESLIDLRIEQQPGETIVEAGDELTYVFTVYNDSDTDTSGSLVEYLAKQYLLDVQLISVTATGGAQSSLTAGQLTSNTFVDTVNLPAGSSLQYEIQGLVAPRGTAGLPEDYIIYQVATLTAPTELFDPYGANNQISNVDIVQQGASSGSGVFFELPQSLATEKAVDVQFGDLDGDGDLDAVVVYNGPADEVLLNDGEGNYVVAGTLGDSATLTSSMSVAMADIDNDGDLDVFVSGKHGRTVLWRNNGDATFESENTTLDNGLPPDVLAFVDVDLDGDLDVIEGYYWYENDGTGVLGDGVYLGDLVRDFELGDLDADGDLDAMGYNYQIQNDGIAGFSSVYEAFAVHGNWIVGDLNGDGMLDAIKYNYYAPEVWLNDGNGKLEFQGQLESTLVATQVRLADVDGDDDLDMVLVERDLSVQVRFNDGAGNFVDSGVGFGPVETERFSLGDIDGDGDIDVMSVGLSGVQVWTNYSAEVLADLTVAIESEGTSAESGDTLVYRVTASNSGDIAVAGAIVTARLDGKVSETRVVSVSVTSGASAQESLGVYEGEFTGEVDLLPGASITYVIEVDLLPDGSAKQTAVYGLGFTASVFAQGGVDATPGDNTAYDIDLIGPKATGGTGLLSVFSEIELDAGSTVAAIDLGDVDGDGDLDVLVASRHDDGAILINDGAGNFSLGTNLPSTWAYTDWSTAALVDMDNDGDLDAFLVDRWFRNNGKGVFYSTTLRLPDSAIFGDVDGDGDIDAVAEGKVYFNDGTGVFTASGTTFGSGYITPQLADLDGDGDLDLLYGGSSNVGFVWLNDGEGRFTLLTQTFDRTSRGDFDLGDLDNDGDLDLWMIYAGVSRIYLNNGDATFTMLPDEIPTSGVDSVTLVDIDGDGDLDALTAIGFYQSENQIFLNNGDATFTESTGVFHSDYLLVVEAGDLDGDGDIDALYGGIEVLAVVLNGDVDLAVTLESPDATVRSGETVDYTLTVTNNGPIAVSGAELQLLFNLPIEDLSVLEVVVSEGASASGVTIDVAGGQLVDLLTLPVGGTVTYTLQAVVGEDDGAYSRAGEQFSAKAVVTSPAGVFDGVSENSFAVQQDILQLVSEVPTGIWIDGEQELIADAGLSIAAGDLDGNGTRDLVVGYDTGAQIWWNMGGTFVAGPVISDRVADAIGLADLDGDGDLDVAVSAYAGPVFFKNDGSGNLTKYYNLTFRNSDHIEFADVDGDGDFDFYDGAAWLNDGEGYFYRAVNTSVSDDRYRFGDLSGDGDLDLYLSHRTEENVGHGVFKYIAALDYDDSYHSSMLGDIDGDGDLDVVIAAGGANVVLLNDGTGVLEDSGQRLGAAQSRDVQLADFDGDGDLDALFANVNSDNALWLNDGLGNLYNSGVTIPSDSTVALSVADFDGDGTLDVVTVNQDGATRLYKGIDIGTQPDLAVLLSSNGSEVTLGSTVEYILEVTNNGPIPISGASLTATFDRLVEDLQIVEVSATEGVVSSLTTGPVDVALTGTVDLPAGATIRYTLMGTPAIGAEGFATVSTLTSTAHVTPPEGFISDITPADNSASDIDIVVLSNEAGTGQFQSMTLSDFVSDGRDVTFGDVDGDGDLDILVAVGGGVDTNPNYADRLWLNDGYGNYIDSGERIGDQFTNVITLGDVDGDGDLDLLAGNTYQTTVWLNDGSGKFSDTGQVLAAPVIRNLTLADLDGDGDLDAYCDGRQRDKVLINDGLGNFTVISLGLYSYYGSNSQLGDLDGDGDLDVVRVSREEGVILLNDGAGNLNETVTPFATDAWYGLTLGDIDSDGDLDIAAIVVVSSGYSTQFYTNDGNGAFSPSGDPIYSSSRSELLLIDIDGDNDLDLVTSNVSRGQSVQLNDGLGGFTSANISFPVVSSYTSHLAAGDVDGDGDPDLLLTLGSNAPSLMLNSNPSDLAVELVSGPSAASVGETVEYVIRVSNQGLLPTVAAELSSTLSPYFVDAQLVDVEFDGQGTSSLIAGPVDGSLNGEFNLDPGASITYILRVTIAGGEKRLSATNSLVGLTVEVDSRTSEIDSDNTNDKATFQSLLAVSATSGTDSFVDSGLQLGSSNASDVALGDLDGDGDLDIVVANSLSANGIWINEGLGDFENSGLALGEGDTVAVAIGDLTGNGLLDVVVANRGESIEVYRNLGGMRFTLYSTYSYVDNYSDIALADFNNDGLLDLVVTANGGSYLWNNVASKFDNENPLVLSETPASSVAVGDVDGDGDVDLLITDDQGTANRLWLNDGAGQFSESSHQLGASDSVQAALADLDGDGDLDAVIANQTGDHHVWMNDGLGAFVQAASLTNSLGYATGVALGDLDGDGDIDAAIASSTTGGNQIWLNNGDGTFGDSALEIGDTSTFAMALGDLDADGDVDIISANAADAGTHVWLNELTLTPEIADFNSDGRVDLADYIVWRNHLGAEVEARGTDGDADGNGIVNANDYLVWKKLFGSVVSTGADSEANESTAEAPLSALSGEGESVTPTSDASSATLASSVSAPATTSTSGATADSAADSASSGSTNAGVGTLSNSPSTSVTGVATDSSSTSAASGVYVANTTRPNQTVATRQLQRVTVVNEGSKSEEDLLLQRRNSQVLRRRSTGNTELTQGLKMPAEQAKDEVFATLGSELGRPRGWR